MTVLLLCANLGSMVLVIGMHLPNYPNRVWDIARSTGSYIYFTASYVHTLLAYAFANIDDFTWGTKGLSNDAEKNAFAEQNRRAKLAFVGSWIFSNAMLAYILLMVNDFWSNKEYLLMAIACYGSMYMVTKVSMAVMHHIGYHTCKRWC